MFSSLQVCDYSSVNISHPSHENMKCVILTGEQQKIILLGGRIEVTEVRVQYTAFMVEMNLLVR
jgi:hypothetical protein